MYLKHPGTIKYFVNCFLLLIPILAWNVAFRDLLPESFGFNTYWDDLPPIVFWGEIFFRTVAYGLPLLMPLRVYDKKQKLGLTIYLIGIFLYFLSWRPLVLYPNSDWSLSLTGYMATAVTPLLFLIGINLIGNKLVIDIPYRRLFYFFFITGFTLFHVWHIVIVHGRLV